MKKRYWIALIIVVVAVGITATVVFVTSSTFENTFSITVQDTVSGEWVYKATLELQNRRINGYFGKTYGFSNLKTGEETLKIYAPSYVSQEIPVKIKGGKNVIEEPVEMVGYEIPTLDHFIMIEDIEDGEFITEVRPVGTDGRAVVNHPCVDIRILLMISEQMLGDNYSRTESESGATRGATLFRGEVKWRWDADPSTIFRYTMPIPVKEVKSSEAPYWVMDYLVLVPDARNITGEELDAIVKDLGATDLEAIPTYLDGLKDQLKYFVNESWNVEGGV